MIFPNGDDICLMIKFFILFCFVFDPAVLDTKGGFSHIRIFCILQLQLWTVLANPSRLSSLLLTSWMNFGAH